MPGSVELFRDEYATFFRDNQHHFVELRWTKATKPMSEEQFRAGISKLAQILEQERVPNVVIDVTEFDHAASDDFEPWRQTHIIPRYNAAGVKKFAFLLPPGATETVENGTRPAKEGAADFPTGYFASRAGALKWFDISSG